MKQKTLDRITWALLAIGTAIVCAYNDILAGVILLITFIGIVAVMWVRFYAAIIDDEAAEKAEQMAEKRFTEMVQNTEYHVIVQQRIVNGNGYKEC